jgi:DNA-directed RNA polymerase specialized sigma24 family protein
MTLTQTAPYSETATSEQAYRHTMSASRRSDDREQEEQLVELARRGGKEERNNLLLYLQPYLERFARRLAFDQSSLDYEDLTQEGCVTILARMDQALAPETESAIGYLLKSAYCAIRKYAQHIYHPIATPVDMVPFPVLSLDAPFSDEDDCTLLDTLEDTTFSVVPQQGDRDDAAALDTALRALKTHERTLVVRHFGLYLNAPEPNVSAILRSMGESNSALMHQTLTKLCILLKDTYPQYCSPIQGKRPTAMVGHRPPTSEQNQRLQAAVLRLQEQRLPVTGNNLAREAHIGKTIARDYARTMQAQAPQLTQEERLDRALAVMQAQGEKVTVCTLAEQAHVNTRAASLYLRMHSLPVHNYTYSDGPAPSRLEEAYAEMVEQGEKITIRGLQQRARVGDHLVGDFLREKRAGTTPSLVA